MCNYNLKLTEKEVREIGKNRWIKEKIGARRMISTVILWLLVLILITALDEFFDSLITQCLWWVVVVVTFTGLLFFVRKHERVGDAFLEDLKRERLFFGDK